jgi:hypothetical protein
LYVSKNDHDSAIPKEGSWTLSLNKNRKKPRKQYKTKDQAKKRIKNKKTKKNQIKKPYKKPPIRIKQ